MTDAAKAICEELAEPFPETTVKFRAGATSGSRALALAYIDARDVMDRLDEIVGPADWHDEYVILEGGDVMGKLSVLIDGRWVTKCDVGAFGDDKDRGNNIKTAFSDALKRAAVKFGIGRYLYALDNVWCDMDPKTKQITKNPRLPVWALPTLKKADKDAIVPPQFPQIAGRVVPPPPMATIDDPTVRWWDNFLNEEVPEGVLTRAFKDRYMKMVPGPVRDAVKVVIEDYVTQAGLVWSQDKAAFIKKG